MKFASVLFALIFIACVRCANTQTPNNELVLWYIFLQKLKLVFSFFKKVNFLFRYNCPPTWQVYNQSCYLKVEQKYDWDSAKAYCQIKNSSSSLIDTSDIEFLNTFGWGGDFWVILKSE